MAAAFDRVDVVGEGVDALGVALVPLQGDLDIDPVALPSQEDDLLVNRRLGTIEVLDEGHDPAFVEEVMGLLIPRVDDGDPEAAVQERQLAQALRQDVKAIVGRLEDQSIRLKGDLGAALLSNANLADVGFGIAAVIALREHLAFSLDLDLERLGEGVDHRHTDAVQPTGHLVRALVELPPGVQLGQDDLRSGDAFGGMDLGRDAAAVVFDRDAAVDVDRHCNGVALAGQRFVDGVVDDFKHQVVQPPLGRITDVHARPLAHGFEPLEHLDVGRPIRGLSLWNLGLTHRFNSMPHHSRIGMTT